MTDRASERPAPEAVAPVGIFEKLMRRTIGNGMILANPDGPEAVEKLMPIVEALRKASDFLKAAPLESGYCCCGSRMEDHDIGSGHSPVDDLQYHASNLADEFDTALRNAGLEGE